MALAKDELGQTLQELEEEEVTMQAVKGALMKLPVWADSLRASAVSQLHDKLVAASTRFFRFKDLDIAQMADMTEDAKLALLQELLELQKTVEAMASLAIKFPSVLELKNECRRVLKEAEKRRGSLLWMCCVEPFQDEDYAGDKTSEAYLVKTLSADVLDAALIENDVATCISTAFETLTLRIAQWTSSSEEASGDCVSHITSLHNVLQKMHRLMGDRGKKPVRERCLKIVEAPVQLRKLMMELAEVGAEGCANWPYETFSQKFIHLKSVQLRAVENSKQTESAGDGALQRFFEAVLPVVEATEAFIHAVGQGVVKRAETFQKEGIEISKKLFGSFSEIQKRGAGLWAAKTKAENFADLAQYASKTLLKEDYVNKVNEHTKTMQKDWVLFL